MTTRRGARLGVHALLGVALAAGCRGEREQAERTEAGNLVRAIELVRAAPREGRGPLIAALGRLPCSAEAACTARRTCTEAYALEQEAIAGLAAVRGAVEADAAVPPGAAQRLVEAERDVLTARNLAGACADREGELRRRHSLR